MYQQYSITAYERLCTTYRLARYVSQFVLQGTGRSLCAVTNVFGRPLKQYVISVVPWDNMNVRVIDFLSGGSTV